MLFAWIALRKKSKVAGLIDCDKVTKKGDDIDDLNKINIEEDLKQAYKKRINKNKIKIFSLLDYKHEDLLKLCNRYTGIQIGLEEMYDLSIWNWLKEQQMLNLDSLEKIFIGTCFKFNKTTKKIIYLKNRLRVLK